MSNVPGDFAEFLRSEDLYPLPLKLSAAFSGVPLGFVQTADAVAAANLGGQIPTDTMSATVQVQGGAIRYTFDGSAPTAARGHRADAGAVLQVGTLEAIRALQWIDEAGVPTTLAVTFWS